MFVLTMNRKGLKRAAVALGCAALLIASAVVATNALRKEAQPTALGGSTVAGAGKIKLKTTDEMLEYLRGMGLEADLASAAVDQVKVPKKWDESFEAFNAVIQQAGLDLSKVKGKTVEKWDFVIPSRSADGQTVSAILLLRKQVLVGAYLISRPSGEVTALNTPAPQPGAEQPTMVELPPEGAPAEGQPVQAAAAEAVWTEEQIAAAQAAIEAAAQAAAALPVE